MGGSLITPLPSGPCGGAVEPNARSRRAQMWSLGCTSDLCPLRRITHCRGFSDRQGLTLSLQSRSYPANRCCNDRLSGFFAQGQTPHVRSSDRTCQQNKRGDAALSRENDRNEPRTRDRSQQHVAQNIGLNRISNLIMCYRTATARVVSRVRCRGCSRVTSCRTVLRVAPQWRCLISDGRYVSFDNTKLPTRSACHQTYLLTLVGALMTTCLKSEVEYPWCACLARYASPIPLDYQSTRP